MKNYLLPIAILLLGLTVIVLDRTALLDPPAYTERGMEAFTQGNYVEAIHQFAQAEKHCETDILARRMLGMSYHNYRWNDEALQQYNDTWNLFAQNAALAMRNAGRIHRDRGEMEEAFNCFQKALAADPDFAGVWADLADLQAEVGNSKAAIEAIEKAVELDPQNPFLQKRKEELSKEDPNHPFTPYSGGEPFGPLPGGSPFIARPGGSR